MRLVYYPIALALAVISISYSIDAARLTRVASTEMDIDHVTDLAWKSALEVLTLSLYSGATEKKRRVADLHEEASRRQVIGERSSVAFAVTSLIYLVARRSRGRVGKNSPELVMIYDLIGVAGICLAIGLLAPILVLKAHTILPVVGEVVLKFEAKSVITMIMSLARANNYFIALLVTAFSVITPLLKIIVAILVAQRRWPSWHTRGLNFIKSIGKWSMADVFVVAVLVAYFGGSNDEFSEARIGLGLYFFTAYCYLSYLATNKLMRMFANEPNVAAEVYPSNHDERSV